MTRKRIGLVTLVAVVLAAGGLLGGLLADSPASGPVPVPPPAVAADQALAGFSLGNTKGTVAQLQQVLRADPKDAKALSLLGLAYQQLGRETGDPSYYSKSEGVLERALGLEPNGLLATSGLGSLALARHDFRLALELGERARELSPATARTYGIVGDALIELGRYPEAFAAFDRMAALKPTVAAYSRVSYARELLGDPEGATQAMQLAVDAARGAKEPSAWSLVQLGKISWTVGDLARAEASYRRALKVFPGYVYALEALAQVEGARGRFPEAIELAKRAVDVIPLPQFVTLLGDLYFVSGQRELARDQYELMDVIRRLLVANGVKIDLETAVYYADHDIRLPEALELARVAQRDRPSVLGDDALAWTLERNGRCEEALVYSKRALRLGTLDANVFFHRGMIERCLGNERAARDWFRKALDLNPGFSLLWAPVAREAIS